MDSPIRRRVGQVFIPVRDLPTAIDWYAGLLGFEPGPSSHAGTVFDIPTDGETRLALDANRPAFDPAGPPRFFLWADDIAAVVSHLQRLGVAITSEVEDIGSVAFVQFQDPDGNQLMVCQQQASRSGRLASGFRMPEREAITALRVAVFGGDGDSLVDYLTGGPWPEHSLQLIGDGLLAALRQRSAGGTELAEICVRALRERGWDGDEELAVALAAEMGEGASPMLRPMPVDLEELSAILEGDPMQGGGRIELATGQVWSNSALEYEAEMRQLGEEADEDPERWLSVHCEGSRDSYRDMELFIDGLDDAAFAERLHYAIEGRGAFRRFKDRLYDRPELVDLWYALSNDRQRGRARRWLAASGFAPVPPGPAAAGEPS